MDSTNLTASFTNLSSNATRFIWDFGDGNLSSEEHPIYQYAVPGIYSVALISFGPCGTDTAYADLTAQCVGTTAGFVYQTDSLDLQVSFENRSNNADQYFWDFGDGFTDLSSQPVHVYASPNYYEVSLIAMGACEVDTFRQIIRPDCNAPGADLITSLDSLNGTISILAEPEGADAFQWDFGGGTADPTSLSPNIVFPSPGLYTITLELSNLCGTSTYQTQLYLPPVLVSRQVLLAEFPQWKAYPNPTCQHWWVETESGRGEAYEFQVVDVRGQRDACPADLIPWCGENTN